MNKYNETDRLIHLLSQFIAKANRTFVAKEDDDSHTSLYLDPVSDRLTGRWIKSGDRIILPTLNLSSQTFEWVDTSLIVLEKITTVGKTIDQIESEIEEKLGSVGLGKDGFRDDMHYEIPPYSFSGQPVAKADPEGLDHWRHFRNLANHACWDLLGFLQQEDEVRIWPHHFDTGIYTIIHERIGIGFGLAMEDQMAGSPYFYMAGYPLEGNIVYKDLPSLSAGRWETGESWNGAILPLTTIEGNTHETQLKTIRRFLATSTTWFVRSK